jgi:hypothetical protein
VQTGQAEGACGAGAGGFSFSLRFTLSGKAYVLGVDILDYHGRGVYPIPPERVSVRSETLQGVPTFLPATSGSVTVEAGGTSGRIDAKLGTQGEGRLTGSWACR